MPEAITAVLLAGSRPGPDPLLDGSSVSTKALLPIAGCPMVTHPLSALKQFAEADRIVVYANRPEEMAQVIEPAGHVQLRQAERSIARTVENALQEFGGPLLIVTADHVLLTAAMLRHFLEGAQGSGVAAAMVERRVLEQAGYQSQRTWLKFRGGSWSGANLFWLKDAHCLPLIRFWASIEQDRKKGRRIIAAFGPFLALAAALRLADVHTLFAKAGRRFGLNARVVPMPQAEACIDADKPGDILLIECLLEQRRVNTSGT